MMEKLNITRQCLGAPRLCPQHPVALVNAVGVEHQLLALPRDLGLVHTLHQASPHDETGRQTRKLGLGPFL